jgi:peptide/nickel transport system substrate-binding protein
MGQEAYSKKPMGTGPYMLKEWEIGEYVLFTKNPYYHIEGLPKTEEIKFIVVLDDNTRLLQLATGQLDIATYVPFSKLQEVDSNPKLTAMAVPSTFTYNIFLNHTRKPYDSQKVREALDYGTDKQALVNFILFGNGEVATSFRPPSSLFYNSSLKDRGYDVEKAKALLAEAGYPNGFDAEFLLRSDDLVFEQISVLIKEQWSKIGINVSIHALESGVGKAQYRAFNYDLIVGPWTDDMNDPSAQCEYYFIPENMDCASTGWTSTERAIELTQKGKRETDLEKREQIYLELQQILYDEVPFIPVFHVPFLVAMSNDIEGFVQNPLGTYRFEELVKNLK